MGYGWVDELPAYCFTVVRGVPLAEVIARLGGDAVGPSRLTFDECFWEPGADQWLQVDALRGGSVLIAEHNCWRASEDDAARRLSMGGVLVSFSADVTGVMRFVYAVDGAVVTAFDPLVDRRPAEGADPHALDHLMADLRFRAFDAGGSAMTLLERVTGLRITRSWLGRPQRAARLPALTC